jgi:NADH dehydrogenase
VNCVGILAPTGEQTFDAVHDEGAAAIAKAARQAGARALVHISAIGADKGSPARYARSKAEGEVETLAAFPYAVILRPSVIFGPEDQFFNRFGAMAARGPVLPAIGGGKPRLQPVFVGDVAEAVALALEGRAKGGRVYELGGPEVLSLGQILERVARYTGRNAKPFPIPFIAAKALAVLTAILPGSLRPVTYDQVKLLQRDNVVSEEAMAEGRTLKGLGITPEPVDAIVPVYLERFRPKGQFSHYRG